MLVLGQYLLYTMTKSFVKFFGEHHRAASVDLKRDSSPAVNVPFFSHSTRLDASSSSACPIPRRALATIHPHPQRR